jgi:hypothetical protein
VLVRIGNRAEPVRLTQLLAAEIYVVALQSNPE